MSQKMAEAPLLKVKSGYYYGTTKGNCWWRRYTKDGLLARGSSSVWVDRDGVHFHRYLTKEVKDIKWGDITGAKLGRWHAGRWTGYPVLKIFWQKAGQQLVSGFTIAASRKDTAAWLELIEQMIHQDQQMVRQG